MSKDMTVQCDNGLINIRVGAIILKDGKFLMVGNHIRPEYLYSVGGRIKFGETAEEAVIRDDMTFGERLKKARIASGINQADAAKKLEMSRPTLSAIEADKRQVLASEILQFAELYYVSVLSLMSDEESEQSVKKNQMTRLMKYQSAFQKMNEDKQKQVLKYMEQLQDES